MGEDLNETTAKNCGPLRIYSLHGALRRGGGGGLKEDFFWMGFVVVWGGGGKAK